MTYLRSETVNIVANSSGESTAFSGNVNGLVHSVEFIPGTLSSAASLNVRGENSSRQILTIAALSTSPGLWYPRQPTHRSTSGSTFGAEGTEVPVINERIRLIVAGGGNGGAASVRITLK